MSERFSVKFCIIYYCRWDKPLWKAEYCCSEISFLNFFQKFWIKNTIFLIVEQHTAQKNPTTYHLVDFAWISSSTTENNWSSFIALVLLFSLRSRDGNSWARAYNTCSNLDFLHCTLSCACPRSGPNCICRTWSHLGGYYCNAGSLVSAKRPGCRHSVHCLWLYIHSSYGSDIYLWNITPGWVGSGWHLPCLRSEKGHAFEAPKPLNRNFCFCKLKQWYFNNASVFWIPKWCEWCEIEKFLNFVTCEENVVQLFVCDIMQLDFKEHHFTERQN